MVTTSLTVTPGDNEPVSLNQAMDNVFPDRELIRNASGPIQSTTSTSATTTGVPDVTAAPQPTIGEQLQGIKDEALRIQGMIPGATQGEATVGDTINLSTTQTGDEYSPFDDDAARRRAQQNQMKLYQAEIDATNQVYDQLLNEARIEGEGRLGSQRAISARGGLLGSDFAGAQKNRVQGFNEDIRRSIGAERQAKIGNIMGNVRNAVVQEVAQKRAAREAGAEEWIQHLAQKDERRENNARIFAQDFIAQGLDPREMDEAELSELLRAQGTNVKPADVIRNYALAQQETEGGDNQFGFMSSSGGIFRTDPTTGEATFIPSGGGTGTGTGGASFNSTQRNKLEQAGLLNAPRQEQLDFLFGDGGSDDDAAQIDTYLSTNRNQDPERMRQDLLNEGFSVSLINSYLETRPMSDRDMSDMATALVSEYMDPKLLMSRPSELEKAKSEAVTSLQNDFESGALFDLFGERTKQLTPQEYSTILAEIQKMSGRETANQLLE